VIIFPAIDLLDGKCVRLKQGVEKTSKVYSNVPDSIATEWEERGAQWLHVVNLDGAFGRSLRNVDVIKRILTSVKIPLQLGGGVRSTDDAARWLELGIARVIFGTIAITEPEIIEESIKKFGSDCVIAGIDARDNKVTIRGWEQQTEVDALSCAQQLKSIGVTRIIHTDVSRDGEFVGPNLKNTAYLATETRLQFIASGGFSQVAHFEAVENLNNPCIEGAIVGTALYENMLDLAELIERFQ
jgi:phosphoribosylformimino-5-aminoimidazole carboxamide ribotide isomerase